jgi:hypothetical protein
MAQETVKTYVACDDGQTYLVDTIEHEGDLWLVPKWLDPTYPSMRKPARIIRLPKGRLQDLGANLLNSGVHARKLDGLVPKALLDGDTSSQSDPPLDVVEAPDLVIRF